MPSEQSRPIKDPDLLGLSALQLPAQALQHLWRGTGYLVPAELDQLISFLRETRDAHMSGFAELKKEYDQYVGLCKTLDIPPDDPLTSKSDWKAFTEFETSHDSKSEKPVDIHVKFARIDKLRAAQQVLVDIDLITRALVKVSKRFSGLDKHKAGEVRLFISARGTSMAMQLVYEPKTLNASSRIGKPSEPRQSKVESKDDVEVLEWLEMGRRALEREKASFRWNAQSGAELVLPPGASAELDSTLDTILTILERDRREKSIPKDG